jgi:hypothetical protein
VTTAKDSAVWLSTVAPEVQALEVEVGDSSVAVREAVTQEVEAEEGSKGVEENLFMIVLDWLSERRKDFVTINKDI